VPPQNNHVQIRKDKNMAQNLEEVYKELLDIYENNKKLLAKDEPIFHGIKIKQHWLEINRRFGLNVNVWYGDLRMDYATYSNYATIIEVGNSCNISEFEDEWKKPIKGELLMQLRFSTGVYLFSSENYNLDYIFYQFFNELKELGAKYVCTASRRLYFSIEDAARVHEEFIKLYEKYKKMAEDEQKKQKLLRLTKQINEIMEG